MPNDELFRRHLDQTPQTSDTPAGVPGKSPVTARLSGRPQTNIILRVESAEAARELAGQFGSRDSNGVAAGADVAVDRAASSSGQALPADVQARFESSLGTDLSSVRVHTGAESADAARAVGARAYTTGQDIHFGAGHYDPQSAFGVHLLAHEVAHTVQQQGAAPTRQNKLEVSTPQDGAEHEADRAADAMVSGQAASVSRLSAMLSRDQDIVFAMDEATPSSQMRVDGDAAVTANRQAQKVAGVNLIDGGTTTVDVAHALDVVGQIDEARGNLGMLQGREEAANTAIQDDMPFGITWQGSNQGAQAIAHNTAISEKLRSFARSSSRQDFQHTFFAESYAQLGEDYLRLKATLDVIRTQNVKVGGGGASKDVESAKIDNPLLGDAIGNLNTAITDLESFSASATGGVAALASSAGSTFDMLGTETSKMRLPPPKFEDTKEQAEAEAEVATVNADLSGALAAIGTIKSVVTAAFSIATAGAGAASMGMAPINNFIGGLGKRAEEIGKNIDLGVVTSSGAKAGVDAATDAAIGGVEGELANWMTNYNARISAAKGRADTLKRGVGERYAALAVEGVRNLQSKLADEVGKFVLLRQQVEAKKAAVAEAAKKVEEQAKKNGKHGTDIGAAAQAMGSVSTFLVQADSTEQLGLQEKTQGDQAQSTLEKTAGTYYEDYKPNDVGGPATLGQTRGLGDASRWYFCKRAPDADKRGMFDLNGYDVVQRKVEFVINEDDVNDTSVVMKDKSDRKLASIAQWKAEAAAFKLELADTLGIGASTIK